MRVCLCALDKGIDISGSMVLISGEPITDSRTATINRAGATVVPRYGTIETGPIAYACLNRQVPDDLHVLKDLHALIQAEDQAVRLGLPEKSLFITGLRPTSPFVMLNVSLGDQAELHNGGCGCPVGAVWGQSIKMVRSFEKLTGAGMNFLDTDVVRVLEAVLPRRFGGAPTDYQLVEREDERGIPRLHLLVRPCLGDLDENEMVRVFMRELQTDSGSASVMGMTWQQADILKIIRQAPYATASGKIMHLHVAKN